MRKKKKCKRKISMEQAVERKIKIQIEKKKVYKRFEKYLQISDNFQL